MTTLPAPLRARMWQPGQSGNPGGTGGPYWETVKLALQAAPDAIGRLITLTGPTRPDLVGHMTTDPIGAIRQTR